MADPSKFQAADWQIVLPGYFEAMRSRLIEGRTFTEADNAPTRKVVIIDQTLAPRRFPTSRPSANAFCTRAVTPEPEWVEVIGVVGHQRENRWPTPAANRSTSRMGSSATAQPAYWAIRTAGDPAKYGEAVRAAIARIDPQRVITDLQPMDVLVDKAQAGTRFSLLLIGVFAVIAALLAGVGLYGVLATVVRQRTRRDRSAHGPGRGALQRFPSDDRPGTAPQRGRHWVGVDRSLRADARDDQHAGGREADGPGYLRGHGRRSSSRIAAFASWIPARRAATLDPTRALREE